MRAVPRALAELRLQAETAARAEDWHVVLGLVDRLRTEDPELWPHLWAPLGAVAAQRVDGNGEDLLGEAVAGGFRQPGLLPEVERAFATHPSWATLSAAMAAPAPPPGVEVTRWPLVDYGPPLVLDRLAPEREAALRERLPAPQAGAWGTATRLLEWTTTRWEHANDHVESEDALEVLDRATAGERFACVEYSILLSQALNAVGIPARRLALRMGDHHVGFGRGHVVSEAWIDDLGRWVLLDGQNGAWWGSPAEPLGVRELQALARAGADRPPMVLTSRELDEADQAAWWRYFATVTSSGLGWADTWVPLFQGRPAALRLAVTEEAITHPDLAQLETGSLDDRGGPALAFGPVHPYATGVRVGGAQLAPGAAFDLGELGPGAHQLEVRTCTAYGELAAQPLHVTLRT